MVTRKSTQELAILKEGGSHLERILDTLLEMADVGVNVMDLEAKAEEMVKEIGGRSAFKGYHPPHMADPFPSVICASLNEEVVHGPARDYVLQDGDLITLDIGMQYPAEGGLYTDMAKSKGIGHLTEEKKRLLRATREALYAGIQKVKAGAQLSDVSKAIETHLLKNKLGIVREMVGHGVGYEAHEDPAIPNFYYPGFPDLTLEEGMVLAIEPMATLGGERIKTAKDGFSIVTRDNSLSAHFEHTVGVLQDGYVILTQQS